MGQVSAKERQLFISEQLQSLRADAQLFEGRAIQMEHEISMCNLKCLIDQQPFFEQHA